MPHQHSEVDVKQNENHSDKLHSNDGVSYDYQQEGVKVPDRSTRLQRFQKMCELLLHRNPM